MFVLMSVTMSPEPVDPSEAQLLAQVQQQWNNGNQAGAIDLLRPLADESRPWATALAAWLLMQQGPAGLEESVHYALKAAELGMPWQAVHTFNNLVANLPQIPHLTDQVAQLAAAGIHLRVVLIRWDKAGILLVKDMQKLVFVL